MFDHLRCDGNRYSLRYIMNLGKQRSAKRSASLSRLDDDEGEDAEEEEGEEETERYEMESDSDSSNLATLY